jgi:competence protein ComGC
MNQGLYKNHSVAMTLIEVVLVIALVVILVAVLLPGLGIGKRKYARIGCVNNLKEIGLSYRVWEGDNSDMYPMGISVTNGGSMEMVATGNVLQTYLVMSNELSTPKLLHCPKDLVTMEASSFGGLANSNLSYFVGVDVTNETYPQMMLSGDANFEIAGKPVKSGLLSLGTKNPVSWAANRHVNTGNIGIADGSVLSISSSQLRDSFQESGLATDRLAIP